MGPVPAPSQPWPYGTVTEYQLHQESDVTVDVPIDTALNFKTVIYQVTQDIVQVLDTCGTEWTSRALSLYTSDSDEDNGSVVLSVDIVDATDTTFVECQNDIVTKTYYHVFVGLSGGANPAKDSGDTVRWIDARAKT